MCNIKYGDDNSVPNESDLEDEEEEGDNSNDSDDDQIGNSDFSDSSGDEAVDEDNSDSEGEGDDNEESGDLAMKLLAFRNQMRKQTPPNVDCEDLTVDISFHPSANVLAAATVTGDIVLYKYDKTSVNIADTLEVHTKACRAVEYSEDGDMLFSASKDRSIMISDSRTGKLKEFYDKAHEGALYCLTVINEHVFATGDEDGVIKIWDVRHRDPIFSLSESVNDYVSKMVTTNSKRYLACTSGEGTVTSINIPARKLHVKSEQFESEYTCASLCRNDTKLIVGTANGKLLMYNWGEFGLHNDIYTTPVKKAINCQISISDNIIITGWEDGVIRATYLFPNKALGVVGQHSLSVDALDISHDGKFIASCSLDQKISFWRISYFNKFDFSKLEATDDQISRNLPSSQYSDRKSFFADLE